MGIRLLLVIDVRLYREGMVATLRGSTPYTVVDAVDSCANATAAIKRLTPDVVVVDMAVSGALDLIREIRSQPNRAAIVAFAVNEVTADIIRCAEAGASTYVTADASIEILSAAIQGAVSGELRCPPHVASELFRRLGKPQPARAALPQPFLTGREREVLEYLQIGLSNKEIGQKMCVAESTVKNHVHHVLEKLEVRTRGQAAARAFGRRELATTDRRRAAAAVVDERTRELDPSDS